MILFSKSSVFFLFVYIFLQILVVNGLYVAIVLLMMLLYQVLMFERNFQKLFENFNNIILFLNILYNMNIWWSLIYLLQKLSSKYIRGSFLLKFYFEL